MKPSRVIFTSGFILISILVGIHYLQNPNGDTHLGSSIFWLQAVFYGFCHLVSFGCYMMRRRWIEDNNRLEFRSIGFTAFLLFFSNVFTFYLITAPFMGLTIDSNTLIFFLPPASVGAFVAGVYLYVYRKKWA
jgi:hypothetical protein